MRISDWSSDVCFSDLGLGLHGYTLQGFTDVLTSPGKECRSQAGNISVAGDASRVAAGVALSASIEAAQMGGGWSGSIHTDALLKPGQFLVLSTTGIRRQHAAGRCPGTSARGQILNPCRSTRRSSLRR